MSLIVSIGMNCKIKELGFYNAHSVYVKIDVDPNSYFLI